MPDDNVDVVRRLGFELARGGFELRIFGELDGQGIFADARELEVREAFEGGGELAIHVRKAAVIEESSFPGNGNFLFWMGGRRNGKQGRGGRGEVARGRSRESGRGKLPFDSSESIDDEIRDGFAAEIFQHMSAGFGADGLAFGGILLDVAEKLAEV